MILPIHTLVAVADGEKLHLYRNTGTETHLELTQVPTPPLEKRTAGGASPISDTAHAEIRHEEEAQRAIAVALSLNEWALHNDFEHLLVIAAPRTMGELRKHFHKAVSSKIVGEITKTLTNSTTEEIRKAILAA